MNNGSLGVAPRPVVATVASYLEQSAGLMTPDYPRWGYETMDAMRQQLADYVGCAKDDLAIVHNATEAMSIFSNGIDLKAGDEVVMTNQEHPSGRSGWRMRAARYGITVREVTVPLPPRDPGQLADLMISAIGPKTRVLSFSGITTTTGLIFPVKEICEAARRKGVLTVVDGAHMHGQIPVKIRDLGCDFFAGSPHKWMFAPAGCGFLYVHPDQVEKLWPLVVTGDWDTQALRAGRFMRLGTNNRAILEGMMAGLEFGRAIGNEAIYARIKQLGRRVRDRAARLPYIELLTPDDDRMFAGLVTLRFKKDAKAVWEEMARRRIWTLQGEQVRVSTHIHTRPEDIDQWFDIVESHLGKG
jgi:selenocysteine lyase/cysteine desulfurase